VIDPSVFADYLVRTRWFGGKGRPFTVTDVRTLGELRGSPPLVQIHLVEVTYGDAEGGREHYQVPLAYYPEVEHRLDHAFVGWWEDSQHGWVHAYDALHDRDAMAHWLKAFHESAGAEVHMDRLRFVHLGDAFEPDAPGTLLSGEQSNSSVAFGESALMKVFRKVTPGTNPDITVHAQLTRAQTAHIARLYGWLEAETADGEVIALAMLQQFLRTATDGWELALASVRSLFGDPSTRASESGGDFAGEATRLGEALREVHAALREHFPTPSPLAASDLSALMTQRLDAALAVVPDLAPYADDLRARFAAVADLGAADAQQVHGDLHLGQTLRTVAGWTIVDFEGEPAKSLAERQRPDSPWRDVAGMLRSLDYAPRVAARSLSDLDPSEGAVISEQAEQWAERNKNHFLVSYAGGGLTPEQHLLLEAYLADKAVYEAVYETRNRPAWAEVPLAALARMTSPRGAP
jgi:maltokinase